MDDCRVTYSIATAVDVKLSGRGDTGNEPEQNIQHIQNKRQQWMYYWVLLECDEDEVEEAEHGEDNDEHVVVDKRRVAADCICDDVADEGHDDESPEELCCSQHTFGVK